MTNKIKNTRWNI